MNYSLSRDIKPNRAAFVMIQSILVHVFSMSITNFFIRLNSNQCVVSERIIHQR